MDKELKFLVRLAESEGWTVTHTGSGHVRFLPVDKEAPIVIASLTPGNLRARKNLRAQLRRSGLTEA